MNESTRERILEHARRLFAEKGFDATSVREITRAAGANLGAITYHFGSKESLYDAVLDQVFAPIRESSASARVKGTEASGSKRVGVGRGRKARAAAEAPAGRDNAEGGADEITAIEQLVAGAFDAIAATPDVQLLILQQVVRRKEMPLSAQKGLGAMLGAIASLVAAGQRAGRIRAGDPVLMAVSVVSQPAYFSLLRRFAPGRLSAEGGSSPDLEQVKRHAQEFIRSALAAGQERE
jgi:AcrR family transcriptional regulator